MGDFKNRCEGQILTIYGVVNINLKNKTGGEMFLVFPFPVLNGFGFSCEETDEEPCVHRPTPKLRQ